jgi:hypothetical protein
MVKLSLSMTNSSNKVESDLTELLKLTDPANYMLTEGKKGVELLRLATPVQTGRLAAGWDFKISTSGHTTELAFVNNAYPGIPVATMVDSGHATKNGGYVPPRNFITPSITPLFNEFTNHFLKGGK